MSLATFHQQIDAYKKRDMVEFQRLAHEAEQRLDEKYVNADPWIHWIELEWREKAVKDEAVVHNKDGYFPAYEEKETVSTEYVGRKVIAAKKKIVNDYSKYFNFCREYDEFKKKQSQQNFVVNEEIKGLLNFEAKQKERGGL